MRRPVVAHLALLALAAVACALFAPGSASARPARPPVVLIVLDEFPVADLMTPGGALDGRRFPGFASLANGSTWFPNAYAVHDSTHFAVPAILTGLLPRPGTDASYLTHPRSIFTFMDRLGYRVRSREEATTVCPPRLCSRGRHYGNPHYNILHRRRERLERTISALHRSKQPTFTLHHSVLPHVPWVYLPSGRSRSGYAPGALPDFASPAGFGDSFLTLHNEQRHLLQAGFVDREIGELVTRLKAIREWRRALVVVTADQALSFDVGTTDRRMVTEANIHEVAPVPLFVKRPGQTRGGVSRAYATGVDILPTIADLLHVPLRSPVDGVDVFGRSIRRRKGVRMLRRDLSGTIDVSAREMEARRLADRLRRASIFGTGPWSRVYRIGPNRSLLGRRVPPPLRTASGKPYARLAVPRDTRTGPHAKTVPTLVAGKIVGGSPSGGRDLAVAVNGRVAAVGRSFHLAGSRTEWFSLNFPESRLRRGSNSIAVYEVASGDRLTLLGPP